jgi:hypothetical protein
MKALHSFKTLGSTCPTTQVSHPEDLNQQHHWQPRISHWSVSIIRHKEQISILSSIHCPMIPQLVAANTPT